MKVEQFEKYKYDYVYTEFNMEEVGRPDQRKILNAIKFGPKCKKIAERAFTGDIDITHVYFGENVQEIGRAAFEGCTSLKELELNQGLKKIKDKAFKNCCSITKLTIPTSVEECAPSFCDGCVGLQDVYCDEKLFDTVFATKQTNLNLANIYFIDEEGKVTKRVVVRPNPSETYYKKKNPPTYPIVMAKKYLAERKEKEKDGIEI